jgi:hypothetical protein
MREVEHEAGTSGQFVPKSESAGYRQKSNIPPHSERLHQDGDSSGFAARAETKQTRRTQKSAHRAERTGTKLETAQKKKAKQKPYKRPGVAGGVSQAAKFEAWQYVHGKIHQVEHENVGTETAHRTELAGERVAHGTSRFIKQRNRTRPARRVRKWEKRDVKAKADYAYKKLVQDNPELKKKAVSRFIQKQRIKWKYQKQARQAAKKGARSVMRHRRIEKTAVATKKITAAAVKLVAAHPHILLIAGIIVLLIITLQSCMGLFASIGGGGAGAVGGAVQNAETIYTGFETALQFEISNMETTHPGYDEYRYVRQEAAYSATCLV